MQGEGQRPHSSASFMQIEKRQVFSMATNPVSAESSSCLPGLQSSVPASAPYNWNSTCYLLADRWMALHGIAPALCTCEEAKTKLYAWIKQRWDESAVRYLKRKLNTPSYASGNVNL